MRTASSGGSPSPWVDVTTTSSFFTGDLFEFIVASVHQFHVQLRGLANRRAAPATRRVAGLRSGNQGDGRRFYRLSGRAYPGVGC